MRKREDWCKERGDLNNSEILITTYVHTGVPGLFLKRSSSLLLQPTSDGKQQNCVSQLLCRAKANFILVTFCHFWNN